MLFWEGGLTLSSAADSFAFSASVETLRIPSRSGSVFARAAHRRGARREHWLGVGRNLPTTGLRYWNGTQGVQVRYWGSRKPDDSCLMRREQAVRLARLLPVRPLSVVLMLLFALVVEPSGDVARWNRPSWFMRNNCAGVDDQSRVEFRSGEVLGFRFSLKCLGRSRASPFQHCAAFMHLKSNVPSIRHLS
jgi:hypothetical protein